MLAYYKPGYYRAAKNFSVVLGKRTVPVFIAGKEYYVYPVQHSEVIQLPETTLLDASTKRRPRAR